MTSYKLSPQAYNHKLKRQHMETYHQVSKVCLQ